LNNDHCIVKKMKNKKQEKKSQLCASQIKKVKVEEEKNKKGENLVRHAVRRVNKVSEYKNQKAKKKSDILKNSKIVIQSREGTP